MANYDKTLERMKYLMEYDNSLNESKKTNSGIEYHTTAADGKEYGIIKEGRRFYIKTTTPDKKEIAESYDYINGYNYRNENGYNSYNEATKQLELRLMSINEAAGKHEDVSVANLNATKDALAILTEDARKELDRMHAIFENSYISKDNIGNHGNPEGKGSATGANTKKNNDPFTEPAKATLDKDPGFKGTVEGATDDHNKPSDPDNKLQHADKMEKGKRGDEDYKDTHDDLDGEGVADKNPKGGKAVKMNEGLEELGGEEVNLDALAGGNEINPDDFHADDVDARADQMSDLDDDIFGDADNDFESDPEGMDDGLGEVGDEDGLVGMDDDLDSLLEEFLGDNFGSSVPSDDTTPIQEEEGSESILKGDPSTLAGDAGKGDNDVHGEDTMDKTPLQEDEENHKPEGNGPKASKITGPDAVMDSEMGAGSGDNNVHGEKTMDKMDEAIERIAESVCNKLCGKDKKKEVCPKCGKEKCECGKKDKKETLQEAIDRIVKEEITKLDAWGKHPRYQKPAFRTPANKEVLAGTATDDWNDESTKGEQPYGQKIGDGKPFDKTVEMLTDQVLANLKEALKLGKK